MAIETTNSTDQSEKMKALEAARLQIEKQFGQGSLMKLGTRTDSVGIEVIPSGSIMLDEALGIGGYPRGRIIEIYGPESSGKTTLALHAIAEAQKMGGVAAFIDAEHALDPVYAKTLGRRIICGFHNRHRRAGTILQKVLCALVQLILLLLILLLH